ncbi:MAG: N-acetylmuramoyl-L-alanine amidase, partial [Lutibacter sp.]|nr:N-acetylmuramoyl-L-alanine amidase [Lutibacter sp.]
ENSVILLEDNYQQHYKGYDPNSPGSFIGITMLQEEYLDQSIELAGIIQQQFTAALKRRDRGVKQAGFVVLHQTYMPSVLIETGFITHKKEGLYLNSTKGKKQLAKAIYQGVKKYIDRLRINTVDTEIVSKPSVEKPTTKKPESKLLFRVQIAAGSRKLATEPYNFKGLENIERVKAGTVYRYYFGKSDHYAGITKFHKTAKSKGYTSSFVVAFREGKRVPLDQVLEK